MMKNLFKKVIKGNAEADRIQRNLDDLKDNYTLKLSQFNGMI